MPHANLAAPSNGLAVLIIIHLLVQADDTANILVTQGNKQVATACLACHGANGEGKKVDGKSVFPPLWGSEAFNWGAGMHRVNTAAAFIKANMPLAKGGTLTNQEAWDVATYVMSHERPQDPRFKGDVAQTKKEYHDENCKYGESVDGKVLGGKH